MTILVIAEHNNQELKQSTLPTITAATELGKDIHLLIAGHHAKSVIEKASGTKHLTKIITADNPAYEHQLAENLASLIAEMANDYSHILAPASTFGKNLMPRLAALLDVGQLSDITEVISEDTFKRPIYAGNAFATVKSLDPIKVITVRTTAFDAATAGEDEVPLSQCDIVIDAGQSQFIKQELTKSERPELTSARIVISGGRGLQSGENFKMLEDLADRLNAAIGASRAAVDAGFVPNDYQVGQTGKIVAPELYIAIGISGAIQHLAGMKDSKIIVVINKDPDAPIFQISDYGIVGDLFEIVPEFTRAIEEK